MLKNAIFLFVLAVAVMMYFLPAFSGMQDIKQKNLEYEQRIVQLKEENARLQEEKRLLQDDPEYLEKVAREKMGLIREGEIVYRLSPVPGEQE